MTAITPRAEIWIAIIISVTTEHNATDPPTPLLKPHRTARARDHRCDADEK